MEGRKVQQKNDFQNELKQSGKNDRIGSIEDQNKLKYNASYEKKEVFASHIQRMDPEKAKDHDLRWR